MAKTPETMDRFRIQAETSTDNVGNLLRALTIMGIHIVGCEMITDVPTFRKNNGKKHEVSSVDFAKAWIEEHPSFNIGDLVKHFKEAGRNTSQVYATVKVMVKHGALTKTGDRSYQFGVVKALPAPAKKARASRKGMARYAVSNRDLILQAVGEQEEITIARLGEIFKEQGRPYSSVSAMLSKMVDDKLFSSLGEGRYRVLAKAKKEAAKYVENSIKTEPGE